MSFQYERPVRRVGARLFNAVGRSLRSRGFERPLRVPQILSAARRRTGLEDWGDEDFLEGLSVFVDALETEAELNPLGRKLMRTLLVLFVMNRLKVRYQLAAHPDLGEVGVRRPIFVIGLPRTGTTLLAEMLAMDPAARPLLTWETFAPALGPRQRDHRPLRAKLIVQGIYRLSPGMETVHPLDADGAEEDTWLLANTMLCGAFTLFGRVPSYFEWLRSATPERQRIAYEFYRSELQVLQGGASDRHWIVKSPAHSATLQGLLAVFPDARVVRTTRPAEKVVPSTCSLVAVSRSAFSDAIRPELLGAEVREQLAHYERSIEAARALAPDRVVDLEFGDLLADPAEAVRRLYERFDLQYSPELDRRLERWAAAPPPPPAHRYTAQDFGLSPDSSTPRQS